MKKSLLILCFIADLQFISAQISLPKIHSLNISSVAATRGASQTFTESLSFNDFKQLVHASELLNRNYYGFQENHGGNYGTNTFSILTAFQFANKEKTTYRNTPLLRIGINYHGSNVFYAEQSKETISTYDVLQSWQTGMYVVFDSVYHKSASIDYRYDQFLLDGSILLRTNPERRFSFYTGAGVTAGTSIFTTFEIYYGESSYTEVWFPPESGFYDQRNRNYTYYNEADENFKLRNNKSAGVYIPAGIDYRLAKKKKYWNHIHFVFEARGGINALQVSRHLIRSGFQIDGTMGLKVEW